MYSTKMVLKTPVPSEGGPAFHFYIVPKGTTLYRGFPRVRDRKPVRDDFHFVTTNQEAASKYGVPFPLVTDREYRLLAMDHKETLDLLYESSPPNIKKILHENYGHGQEASSRDSVFDNDVAFSKYLCTLGHDGYATRKMENRDSGRADFHEELMFCDTSHLKIGKTNLTDAQIEQIVLGMSEKKHARDLKKLRKKKASKSKSPSPLPFALGSPEDGYRTPGGGGGRTRRRRRLTKSLMTTTTRRSSL